MAAKGLQRQEQHICPAQQSAEPAQHKMGMQHIFVFNNIIG
jgi:hypothetical protein